MATYSRKPVPCHHCGKIVFRQPNEIKRARYMFCSPVCKQANPDFKKYAAERNGDVQRFNGQGVSYVKQNGRHQHRIVAEKMLGRPLRRGEIVHHIDGDKHNNSPENLSVMKQSEHIKLHLRQNGGVKKLVASCS